MKDITKIWTEIHKPEKFKDTKIEEFLANFEVVKENGKPLLYLHMIVNEKFKNHQGAKESIDI